MTLFDFALQTEDINQVLANGGFTGTSVKELEYFEKKGASLELLDRLFSYDTLYRDCIEFFLARGYKHQAEFETILRKSNHTAELEHLINLGGVPSSELLEEYYSSYLLTHFPPHNNETLQVRAIARNDVAVIANLNINQTRYSYTLIDEQELYSFDQNSSLYFQQTFTALDIALLVQSYDVARFLIERNAGISINVAEIVVPDDIQELLFYNYGQLDINLTFNINRARELWNPINRQKMETLTTIRSRENTALQDIPNELLFRIAYYM